MKHGKHRQIIQAKLKGKAKPLSKAGQDWLTFSDGATEIAKALSIANEPASMLLYGLCATGNVRCVNDRHEIFEAEECTIAALEGKPAHVAASDVRNWLAEWSKAPSADIVNTVIEEMLRAGDKPGRNIHWEPFCNKVRDACKGGWLSKGNISKHRPGRGFSTKQIKRKVKDLEQL
jgi:hypothetical protein